MRKVWTPVLVVTVACTPVRGSFETSELPAEAVDETYTLTVFTPEEAVDGGDVVYLFDGDDWTDDVARIVTRLADDGLTPPRVVGIGYGDRPNQRARDLTPAGPGVPDGWGEVEAFFTFLEDELVPFIDGEHATAATPETRIVLGHSFGGAASVYGLLAARDTFGHAVALSPSLTLGEGALFELEAEYAEANDDLPARVHLGAGALEAHGLAGLTEAMGETLDGRDYPNLALQTELVPGRVHTDVFGIAAEDGLRFVLEGL